MATTPDHASDTDLYALRAFNEACNTPTMPIDPAVLSTHPTPSPSPSTYAATTPPTSTSALRNDDFDYPPPHPHGPQNQTPYYHAATPPPQLSRLRAHPNRRSHSMPPEATTHDDDLFAHDSFDAAQPVPTFARTTGHEIGVASAPRTPPSRRGRGSGRGATHARSGARSWRHAPYPTDARPFAHPQGHGHGHGQPRGAGYELMRAQTTPLGSGLFGFGGGGPAVAGAGYGPGPTSAPSLAQPFIPLQGQASGGAEAQFGSPPPGSRMGTPMSCTPARQESEVGGSLGRIEDQVTMVLDVLERLEGRVRGVEERLVEMDGGRGREDGGDAGTGMGGNGNGGMEEQIARAGVGMVDDGCDSAELGLLDEDSLFDFETREEPTQKI